MTSKNNIFPAEMLEQLGTAFVSIPFNRMLGLKLEQLTDKQVVMSFEMKDELIGNFMHGILHGGVISSVLDMAGGMVVMAHAVFKNAERSVAEIVEILSKCSTVDLQVSYVRPGRGKLFHAKAWLVKSGNKINFTRMELHNQDETLIATSNGTYLLT